MKKKLIEVALPLEAINIASAREKSIRHSSPAWGGSERVPLGSRAFMPAQGSAISTVQPRSVSASSFNEPSTCTAVRRPGNVQLKCPSRPPRGWFL